MLEFNKEYLIKAENKVEAFQEFYELYINDVPEKFIAYINWKKMLNCWIDLNNLKIKKIKNKDLYVIKVEE